MDAEVREAPSDFPLVLGPSRKRTPARARRWLILALVVTLLITVATALQHGRAPKTVYISQPVTLGSLTVTVTATGNLQPRNQVDVGSELSGIIRAVNVDVNDSVTAGEVLAALDTSRLQAQVLQAESSLASAHARLVQASASRKEARANQGRLLKVRELSGNRLPSQQDLDVADAAVARAVGGVAAAEAAVAQARAALKTIRTDLTKAEIRSPISGVVLVRAIEPGQTVAASLQAPILFTLAEDLRKMELHVAIDEADIGTVKVGQQGTFTVDAFRARAFSGTITRIHMASNGTRNGVTSVSPLGSGNEGTASATAVVTYETVLAVDNSELVLRPGMTATAEIATSSIAGAVLVPNAAMRFTPPAARFPGMDDDSERGTGMMALMPYLAERWKCPREDGQVLGCVWVLENGKPALAVFKPGATDRSVTQVMPLEQLPRWGSLSRLRNDKVLTEAVARKLKPGSQVIVGSTQPPKK